MNLVLRQTIAATGHLTVRIVFPFGTYTSSGFATPLANSLNAVFSGFVDTLNSDYFATTPVQLPADFRVTQEQANDIASQWAPARAKILWTLAAGRVQQSCWD